jgi:hypothetical protein
MPIVAEVVAALGGERTPADAVDALMGRVPTTELHDLRSSAIGEHAIGSA